LLHLSSSLAFPLTSFVLNLVAIMTATLVTQIEDLVREYMAQ